MINFRYHIISITAVFLALAVGLALGTSFGNRALVNDLKDRQDELDTEVRQTRTQNSELTGAISTEQERSERFTEQAVTGPLVTSRLVGVPVLAVAPRGIDENTLELVRTALESSGADFAGTLRLDDRLALEGDNATRLAELLGLTSTDPAAVQRALVNRLSTVLLDAGLAPGPSQPPGTSVTGPTATSTTSTTNPPGGTGLEPVLITELREEGFVDFEPPSGGDAADPLLTGTGYRYLFVTGPDAVVADEQLLFPLVRRMVTSQPEGVPVVVATGVTGDPLQRDERRAQVLAPLRDDANVTAAVSTVDDIESYEGIFATILALEELGQGEHGQYGVGEGVDPLPGS